jgi:hypothetical protein
MKTERIPAPPDWKNLKAHTLADVVEFGAGLDIGALAEHIRVHGYYPDEAIVIFKEDGEDRILDGRARHSASIIACVTPTFKRFVGASAEAYVAKKAFRAHLTTSQRAMIAALIATAPRGDQRGRDKDTRTNEQAARQLNVSERMTRRAKSVVTDGVVELQDAVKKGKISASDAASITEEPDAVQRQAVQDVIEGKAETAAEAVKKRKARKAGRERFEFKKVEKTTGAP